jgi:hypothetical protein
MTSPAQQAANARNAQKSRGPTSEEGKRRSSMNAVKHGLTAKTVLLPDEDLGEFREMMVGWFQALKPRDPVEVSLVERAVCANWRLNRINRAQSARLCLNAHTAVRERKRREHRETKGLLLRLLKAPQGRLTALPLVDQSLQNEDEEVTTRAFDAANHPSLLVGAMMESEWGCLTLFQLWKELRASLENGAGCWGAAERFRVFRLLSIHPIDAYITAELASMLQACQVLDPDAGSLVGEVWNEFVSADALTALEKRYQAEIAHLARPDQDGARAYLLEIATREMDGLADLIQSHQERDELEAVLEKPRAAFDGDREGDLIRRYQVSSEKHFDRCLERLEKWPAQRKRRMEEDAHYGGHYLPSPRWFEEVVGRSDLFDLTGEAKVDMCPPTGEAGHSRGEAEALREQRLGGGVGRASSGSMSPVLSSDDMEDRAAAEARSERDESNRVAECALAASDAGDDDTETCDEGEEVTRGDREAVLPAIGNGMVVKNGSNRERKRRKRLERERLRQEGRLRAAAVAVS